MNYVGNSEQAFYPEQLVKRQMQGNFKEEISNYWWEKWKEMFSNQIKTMYNKTVVFV